MPADDRLNDPLEKNLHAVLRGQPALRAPSSLEQRVRAEIARRAERPWWRRSFVEWPVLPRAAFVALSSCAAVISIAAALALMNGPGAELAAGFLQKFSATRDAMHAWLSMFTQWLAAISPGWFYLAGGVVAAAGVGLLGLGATAYRLLWKSS